MTLAVGLVAVGVLSYFRFRQPVGGASSPQVLTRAYIEALTSGNSEAIESLVWKDWDASREAREQVRAWAGVQRDSIHVQIEDHAVGKQKTAHLRTDSSPYLRLELSLVQQIPGRWYLALGERRDSGEVNEEAGVTEVTPHP